MDQSRKNAIISMIIGVILVGIGFFISFKIGAIFVQLGILLIFGPLLLVGFNIKNTNKKLGNIMILVSAVFVFAVIISLLSSLMMLI